jgi:hypothetical protein
MHSYLYELVLLNNLILAIRDHKTSDALAILSQISSATLKKKKNGEVNKAFLLAMAHRLEDITLSMYERGFPSDVNSPIFSKPKNTDRGGMSGLKFPSYFILAVALGLYDLVKAMLKVISICIYVYIRVHIIYIHVY